MCAPGPHVLRAKSAPQARSIHLLELYLGGKEIQTFRKEELHLLVHM